MKRFGMVLAVLLCAAALTVTLTGCFGKGNDDDTTATTTLADTATTTADIVTTTAPAYPFTGYVNATTLHVRPTADTSGDAIGGLVFGNTVTVTGREGDWYKISFGSGVGYVSAQYIQDTPPESTTLESTTTQPDTDTTTADAGTTTDAGTTSTAA